MVLTTKNTRPRRCAGTRRRKKTIKKLYVLIACEESQAECKAFRELGHIAYSCDLQECKKKGNPAWHIHDDALTYLAGNTRFVTQDGKKHWVPRWDLIIAHPPCTYLCKVGSMHLYKNRNAYIDIYGVQLHVNSERWENMQKARRFFMKCLNAEARFVAVENPIPMRLANLPRPSTYADPSWFGVKYTKKTCYWLRNLPPLMAEIEHYKPKCFVRASRGKYRSRTFPQLAKAIARQWSAYILDELNREATPSD